METTALARAWNFPHRLLEFRYDYLGRRVQKRTIDVTLNQEISCRRFLYDGWNLIAEYAAPGGAVCGALLRSYTWGLDIALSMSNAGGVGALLQIADHPSGKTFLPTYDGNGNIAALVNATSGALAAAYEYSPYGEPLRAQTIDPTVADNPFRFSTKFTDVETGLVYYGHRFYDPKNGRFINKDPIEETGGLNLYGFCGNNAVNRWDFLGCAWSVEETDYGTFWAKAWDSGGGWFVDLGEWNFGSREDAENWAASRSAWNLDERGEVNLYIDIPTAPADAFIPKNGGTVWVADGNGGDGTPVDGAKLAQQWLDDRIRNSLFSQFMGQSWARLDAIGATNSGASGYGIGVGGFISPLTGQTVSGLGPYWTVDSAIAPNNAAQRVTVESHWLLRSIIPGQIAWDNARTAAANGEYGSAVVNTIAMGGEIVLTVLTLGQSTTAQNATRATVTTRSQAPLTQSELNSLNRAMSESLDFKLKTNNVANEIFNIYRARGHTVEEAFEMAKRATTPSTSVRPLPGGGG